MACRLRVRTAALMLVLLGGMALVEAAEIHVAPKGNDAHAGAASTPFATIKRAQEWIRAKRREKPGEDLTIVLHGGRYELDETLVFGAGDGGSDKTSVIWRSRQGDTPVLSGGRVISQTWTRAKGGVWQCTIPAVKAGKWFFRDLYVDGKRQPRARFPNDHHGDHIKYGKWRKRQDPDYPKRGFKRPEDRSSFLEVMAFGDKARTMVRLDRQFPGDLAGQNAEAVIFKTWNIARQPILSGVGKQFVMKPLHGAEPATKPWLSVYVNRMLWLEHARQFIDVPGEWHLNRRTGVLSYLPKAGVNPNNLRVVAPKLESLVQVQGKTKEPVRNLHFRGITFEHTNWLPARTGFNGTQAHYFHDKHYNGGRLPDAVKFTSVETCSVRQCTVTRTGASGIGFWEGFAHCSIQNCHIYDTGGNGVTAQKSQRGPMLIADNTIHDCGRTYFGTHGIFEAHAPDVSILHNHVYNIPYGGIAVGWQFNDKPRLQRRCHVANNHIHHVMTKLFDSAGIYTLGAQPDSVFEGNFIHHVFNGRCFQHDQGSSYMTFRNNVCIAVNGQSVVHANPSHDIVYENNLLIGGREYCIGLNSWADHDYSAHKGYIFRRNVIIPGTTAHNVVHAKPQLDPEKSVFKSNLYWSTEGKMRFMFKSFADWQKLGFDTTSVVADPKFTNPGKLDFSVPQSSAIHRIGIKDISLRNVGPRSSPEK